LDAQNRDVGRKLGMATALMFTLPIAAYFITLHWIQWSDGWAAAAAILVTNCIVGGYCYVAYQEDRQDAAAAAATSSSSGKPSGIYKERTD
jgi:hypothetical protein